MLETTNTCTVTTTCLNQTQIQVSAIFSLSPLALYCIFKLVFVEGWLTVFYLIYSSVIDLTFGQGKEDWRRVVRVAVYLQLYSPKSIAILRLDEAWT